LLAEYSLAGAGSIAAARIHVAARFKRA